MTKYVTKLDQKPTKTQKPQKQQQQQPSQNPIPETKVRLGKKERIEAKRKNRVDRLRQVKGKVSQQLVAAQASTKSMGKFDRKAHKDEREHRVKRRKVYSNFRNIEEQVDRNMQILALVKKGGMKKLGTSL